ncbi:hypothetical protein NLU13_5921 [Sarocladium strictum]|uniref:Uncharacterized protein n=1 Tax=Sarocladium strictum TaxID=5046 RepID=A0AA39GFN3_SARSR|nr:hypothetical protein NLU13_5921 [Sarocladium strictum]
MAATEEATSYFSMPGSFHSEGVHPGLIRPPASPTTTANSPIFASAILTPASPTPSSALPRPKYKRRRPGDGSSTTIEPSGTTRSASRGGYSAGVNQRRNESSGASKNNVSSTARSYVLAGNLDTPGAVSGPGGVISPDGLADHGVLGESMFSDSDYRTVLGSKRRRDDLETDHTAPSTLYKLPSHPSQKTPGWGSFAFSTLGGVVGKVWDFCWGSTFKGFHAGEGEGYDAPHVINHEEDVSDTHPTYSRAPQPPLRDAFTGTEDYNAATSYSRASTPTRQPAKRRQTDRSDDLGRNWVVINQHEAGRASPALSRPSMPRTISSTRPRGLASTSSGHRVTSASMSRASATSGSQTPVSRLSARRSSSRGGRHSAVHTAWEKPQVISTASYASPRSSPAGTSREPSFRDSHRRSQSNASAAATRSPHGADLSVQKRQSPKQAVGTSSQGIDDDMQKQSPRLTEEARRLAAKRRMEERDADVRIAAFNRRLQDMIRQGKEALGTTVDVEMDGPGDGAWEDDE